MFKQINKLFFVMVTCIISGLVLVSSSQEVFAYSATLTTGTDIKLNASPSGDGTSIHEESIDVVSDCRAGYNLSIATPKGSNLYTNGDGSTTAVFTAVDGTSALNSTNNTNKWGYTLTSNPTSSTVFSPLSTTPSILKTVSQTASSSSDINDTFSINYGVKVDNTIVPGSYKMANSGSIVYYLTMAESCNVVDIAYDGNNADAGTMGAVGTGVIHTGVKDGDTVSLIASNFSRSGYGFAGWSLDPDAGTKLIDNDNTNNPVVYGPQEDVTLPDGFIANDTDNDNIVKLYAVWIQSQGNLQGWMGCSNLDTATYDSTTGKLDLTKNSVTALTDMRDHETYAVARLADGNCWMIENLRLEADATRGNNQYDPSVTNEWLSQGYGRSITYGNFVGLADSEIANFTTNPTDNSLYCSTIYVSLSKVNIGTSDKPDYRFPRYNHENTNSRAHNPTTNGVATYGYGNYYTWHAAMANTIYYDSLTTQDADGKTSETVNTSLCPAGWKLPYGNNTGNGATAGGFSNLDKGLGGTGTHYSSGTSSSSIDMSNAWRSFPNNFLYSGYFTGSSASYRGTYGYYWSSTVDSSYASYILNLHSNNLDPGTINNPKYRGNSIRCTMDSAASYTLTFDANGGTGAPVSQVTTANGIATFTLGNITPTRSGYTFTGWADEKGNEVQPGGTYTTKDVNATLYAIWTNNSCNLTATTIGTGNTTTDAVCLQDVTPNMKASLPTADSTTGTYTLIDARDNQSYTVAKLADGNLWLTKNLNYGSSNDTLLTYYDTDLPSGKTFKAPASTTSFETTNSDATYIIPKILTDNTYGGYYSYAAAIASTDTASQNITTSICPKGWDLPTSTQYNNLRTISGNTSFAAMNAAPYSFIYAGYRNGTSFTNQTSTLRLWTSTNYSSSYAYYSTAYGAASSSSNYKRYGESVRCVASNGTVTINYDGNGTTEYPVTGSVSSQVDVDVSLTSTQANGFSRTNWTFSGWNTAADGSGTAIAANTAISNLNPTPGSTITLYAQWTPRLRIIYNDNCSYNNAGCVTSTDTTNTSSWTNAGSNITLGSDTYFTTKSGYIITSWNTARDGSGTSYNPSASYTVPTTLSAPDQVTLYAQWFPALTINFNSNGGSGTMTSQLIPENTSKALKSNSFTAPSGNYFIGWMTEESRANNEVVYTNGATYTTPTTVTPGDSITLYAKWGPRYTIVYNGNNATGGSMVSSGTELKHTNINEGSTVNLYAPNYWKTNYGFVGWSPSSTATVGGTDPIYGPNESISAPSYDAYGQVIDGTKTVTLYAIWLEADNNKTMQTFTTSDCQNLSRTTYDSTTGIITAPAGSVIALKDQRDNNVYTVARLADGNCWMIENLRLDAANTVGNNQYDSSVTNRSLSQGYGGVFTGLDNAENSNFDNVTNATPNNKYSSSNITGSNPGYRFPRYNNNNTNTSLTASHNGIGSGTPYNSWYSYGNYYNWAAAMANTSYYESATGTSGSELAGTSLCPTNWTLPTSGTVEKDFGNLSLQYGGTGDYQYGTANAADIISNRFRSFPNNFLYSGSFGHSNEGSRGSQGGYWSRSATSTVNSYSFYFGDTNFYPSGTDYKYIGHSARCINYSF